MQTYHKQKGGKSMSFCNNCKSDNIPGPLKNNPLNGLCDKTCIECNKVIDMCMKQEVIQDLPVSVSNITPANLVAPFTFVGARTVTNESSVQNLTITDISDGSCNSRISCNVEIPIKVYFVDSNGVQGNGDALISVPKDVILHTAAPSIMPYEIKSTSALIANSGTYIGNNSFSLNVCVTIILKVVMQVHLLVPSYGYCYIPPCVNYNVNFCQDVFDTPLYPQECGIDPRCSSHLK